MVELQGVGIHFSENEKLLDGVSFSVEKGKTFVIVGPSGSGKSVILKMIAGLIPPTKGTLKVDGINIYAASREQRAQIVRRMGMLFQKNALFDSLTVAENLAFPLREASSLSESEIGKKVLEFLDYVQLKHAAGLFPDEISGGMQKRVGIARALVLNPEIILYDDPTAGLDPITSKVIIELILRLKRDFGTTVLAITNDMNRAYQMADHMGIIFDHSLLLTGTVDETKKNKHPFVRDFILGHFKEPELERADVP